MNNEVTIVEQIEESICLMRYLQQNTSILTAIANQLTQAFQRGNKVLLFGNGGSAADAEHFAGELVGRLRHNRDPLAAIALTSNAACLTAIANDFGYDTVFERQVHGLAKKHDVVIGISTSGDSINVLLAIEEAKQIGAVTVAFTGQNGKLHHIVDHVLSIPSTDTPRIQEAHMTAAHIICYLVEEAGL